MYKILGIRRLINKKLMFWAFKDLIVSAIFLKIPATLAETKTLPKAML